MNYGDYGPRVRVPHGGGRGIPQGIGGRNGGRGRGQSNQGMGIGIGFDGFYPIQLPPFPLQIMSLIIPLI